MRAFFTRLALVLMALVALTAAHAAALASGVQSGAASPSVASVNTPECDVPAQQPAGAQPCDLQALTAEIQARYQPEFDALGRAAPTSPRIGEFGAITGFGVELRQRRETISLHLPTTVLRYHAMWADVPQVFPERITILIAHAYTVNENFKCGQYPEFHGLRVIWRDIICTRPVVRVRQEPAHFDRPTLRWQRADFGTHWPEVRLEKFEIAFLVPEIIIHDRDRELGRVRGEAAELQRRAEDLAARMRAEINAAIAACPPQIGNTNGAVADNSLDEVRARVSAAFDQAINDFEAAIARMRAAGAQPPANVLTDLERLRQQRADALASVPAVTPSRS